MRILKPLQELSLSLSLSRATKPPAFMEETDESSGIYLLMLMIITPLVRLKFVDTAVSLLT